MKNYSLLLLFCCTLFLNACGNKDDDPSKEDMLMNKRWQITALTISSMLGSIDYYGSFQSCEKDNYIEFRSGGTLIIDEGPTKCNASAPQQTPGTWSLNGDVLRVTGIGMALGLTVDDLELNVQELTNTTLVGAFTQSYSGFTFNGSTSLKAQ